MNRRRPRKSPLQTLTVCALAGSALCTWPRPAQAQAASGFALNRYEPSEAGSEWFAADTLDIRGKFRPALRVLGDYGYKPYVLLNPDGSENTRIVSGQFFVHLGGSLVLFERLRLGVNVPIAITQEGSQSGGSVSGQRILANTGAGVGDLRLGADLRLIGTYGDAFTLGLGGRVWFPTGNAQKFLGDDEVRVGPHVALAGDVGAFAYAGSVGVVYRANNQVFAGHATGTETNFRLAAGVRAVDKKLLVGPELFGSTIVSNADALFGARTTPLALLLSGHLSAGDFRFGLGAGPGLSHAAGTAAFRALGSIEYAPGIEEPKVATAPPPPADRDGDGVIDGEDACPDVRGIRTNDPRTNGCPSDRDTDGIVDTEDACPEIPGVRTDDAKTNGCPSDRDKDGIYDGKDACPNVPGVQTDDPATNGCPSDRDKDAILDADDACPDVPGPANADSKKHGCPLAFVKDNQIQITDQIKFRFGLADLDPVSDTVLDAVLKVIEAHAEVKMIRIEGHTDNKGSAALNKKLSNARAEAVAKWLVKHGVDRSKLTAGGFGMDKPIDTNDTDVGRANNRRVEFHIEGEGAPKR